MGITDRPFHRLFSMSMYKTLKLPLGQFFPFATYALTFDSLSGSVGFLFRTASREASVCYDGGQLLCSTG